MRISDWSSDVCSSDLGGSRSQPQLLGCLLSRHPAAGGTTGNGGHAARPDNVGRQAISLCSNCDDDIRRGRGSGFPGVLGFDVMEQLRSEEHTSELQSLMRISYAVFCLKKQKNAHEQKIQMD